MSEFLTLELFCEWLCDWVVMKRALKQVTVSFKGQPLNSQSGLHQHDVVR